MSIFKTTKLINFHNNTSEVIILETWTDVMPGLSSFTPFYISNADLLYMIMI